jgi:hypothetical protein
VASVRLNQAVEWRLLRISVLEAAEVVFGQYAEATGGGRLSVAVAELGPSTPPSPGPVASGPGAGGMLLVPHRVDGMTEGELPADRQAVVRS